MRIAIINDTHVDLRNGSEPYMDHLNQFFSKVFFPFCDRHGIKHVIHLGDYFDNRRGINIRALHNARKSFLEPLTERGMTMTIIPGNHDVYYKNSNAVSSLREMFGYYIENVKIIEKPTIQEFDGLPIAFLPWISESNCDEFLEFLSKCTAPILMSHLELAGFEMAKGQSGASHGMNPDLFKRFEMVLSGHYHTKSTRGNIYYLGTQVEQTWADCNDPKYFHVLDTATRELSQIRNPLTLYSRLIYDDSKSDPNETLDTEMVRDKFVKVVVVKRSNIKQFEKFIQQIQDMGPLEQPKIVESFDEFAGTQVEDDAIDLEDTSKLLNTYIDSVETDLDKERLKSMIRELYVEAQSGETQ